MIGAALLACLPAAAQEVPSLRIAGTGAGMALLKVLGARYEKQHPGARVTVYPSLGSTGGIRAVADGRIEIACASRGLSSQEAGLGLAQWTFARTPFVLAVGSSRPETDLPQAQVADVYAGRVRAWRNGDPVRVILRPRSDTAHAQLAAFGPDLEAALTLAHAVPGAITATTDQDCADHLERATGAWGPSAWGRSWPSSATSGPWASGASSPPSKTYPRGPTRTPPCSGWWCGAQGREPSCAGS